VTDCLYTEEGGCGGTGTGVVGFGGKVLSLPMQRDALSF
jgi:hypothetical protein